MRKIVICPQCDGHCGEVDDGYPDSGPIFLPCFICKGTGVVSLAVGLEVAEALEADWDVDYQD